MSTEMAGQPSGSVHPASRAEGGGAVVKDNVARGLGWFSVGLGAAQVAAPGAVGRLIGVGDTDTRRALMRFVGVRELAAGAGILARPKPAGWLWARVAGDVMDLALLGAALTKEDVRRGRVAAAMGAVAGVLGPDVLESARLSRRGAPGSGDGAVTVKQAVTVNRSPDEVYAFWRDFANLPRFMKHVDSVEVMGDRRSHWTVKAPAGKTVEWDAEIVDERPGELIAWRSVEGADVDNEGIVRFSAAPGGRGTEVLVELTYSPPGGPVAATVAKLFGEEPETQAYDDLRRFKQVIETGEVVVSEGSPSGPGLVQQLMQRAAQPLRGEREAVGR